MFRKVVFVVAVAVILLTTVPAMASGPENLGVSDAKKIGLWVCKTPHTGCKVYNQRGQLEAARAWAMTGKVRSGRIWSTRYSSGVPHAVWAYQAHFTWVGD